MIQTYKNVANKRGNFKNALWEATSHRFGTILIGIHLDKADPFDRKSFEQLGYATKQNDFIRAPLKSHIFEVYLLHVCVIKLKRSKDKQLM